MDARYHVSHRLITGLLVLCTATSNSFAADAPVTKVTVLHQFDLTDGAFPGGNLLEGADGVFYGTTYSGGPKGGGTIFRITAAGELTTLFAFGDGATAFEGNGPNAALVRGPDGHLYGTTTLGGNLGGGVAGGYGTIFRLSEQGDLTVLHTFTGDNGAQPVGALLLASDGNFYGTTNGGGSRGAGTVFRMTPNGVVTELYPFGAAATDGSQINAPLVQGPDGILYGSSRSGGSLHGGTVFKITLSGELTTLHHFPGLDWPNPVVFGADGSLYGSTNGGGYAFRITTDGAYTELYRYPCSCGLSEGSQPAGVFTLASDGNLYGVTTHGGLHNNGTVYSMTHDGVLTPLHSFANDESNTPSTGVIEGRDGRFYGTTNGTFNPRFGTVFKLAFRPKAPEEVGILRGPSRVTLSWSPTKSANSYDVFVSTTSAGQGSTPILSGITGTTADVTGLSGGVTHYFTVAATNEAGTGTQSREVSAFVMAAPGNLNASGGIGQIMLNWTAAEGASSYNVYQSTSASVPTNPVLTGVTSTSATISGLTNGTSYFFIVESVYGTNTGYPSTAASAIPSAPTPLPNPVPENGGGGGGAIDFLLLAALSLVVGLFRGARVRRRYSRVFEWLAQHTRQSRHPRRFDFSATMPVSISHFPQRNV